MTCPSCWWLKPWLRTRLSSDMRGPMAGRNGAWPLFLFFFAPLFLRENLRHPLADDHTRHHRVSRGDSRHDRSVGDAQPVDAANLERAVDHRTLVPTHAAGAGLVKEGCGGVADEIIEFLAPQWTGHHLALDVRPHVRAVSDLPTELDSTDERLHVLRLGEEAAVDDRCVIGIGGANRHGAMTRRPDEPRQDWPAGLRHRELPGCSVAGVGYLVLERLKVRSVERRVAFPEQRALADAIARQQRLLVLPHAAGEQNVIAKVLTDSGELVEDRNARGPEHLLVADARKHEEARGVDRPA